MIVGILSLIDLTLIANLILIVICSSYENFVRPINAVGASGLARRVDAIGFAGLKQKLLGSLVAITAVQVLEWFMDIANHADPRKARLGGRHIARFAVTMLLLAIADRVSAGPGTDKGH